MRPGAATAFVVLLSLAGGGTACACAQTTTAEPTETQHLLSPPDSSQIMEGNFFIFEGDTLFAAYIPPLEVPHSGPLTDTDFYEIADSLGVEAAAIKAVVEIETGNTHTGFSSDGKPLINFDPGLFRRAARRHGIQLSGMESSHPQAFAQLDIARYGSHQAAHQARLDAAMAIDSTAAIEATFWGMFQIGGFNWRLTGASSPSDFVRRMSRSGYDQLVLFANFIRNTGLLKHLRAKNWSAFAKLYNGPGYAARGYHRRMAAAYRRYRNELPER